MIRVVLLLRKGSAASEAGTIVVEASSKHFPVILSPVEDSSKS